MTPNWLKRVGLAVAIDDTARGLKLAKKFIEENALCEPRWQMANRLHCMGRCTTYTQGFDYRISINVKACTQYYNTGHGIAGLPWDRTVTGIIAHEIGHLCFSESGVTQNDWKAAVNGEIVPTRYARKSWKEDFSESLMLFITNPALLAIGRPARFCLFKSIFDPVLDPAADIHESLFIRGSLPYRSEHAYDEKVFTGMIKMMQSVTFPHMHAWSQRDPNSIF